MLSNKLSAKICKLFLSEIPLLVLKFLQTFLKLFSQVECYCLFLLLFHRFFITKNTTTCQRYLNEVDEIEK